MKEKVLLGMSGGVDSAASAVVLLQMGYDVTGMTMQLHRAEKNDRRCGTPDDREDAAKVCRQLGIDHISLDFTDRFEETVIGDFIAEYQRGRTPNPCVCCNRFLKFGAALEWAEEHGFAYIATGHYAVIRPDENGEKRLFRSASKKDQSYVLWGLKKEQLKKVLFPLGDRKKDDTRRLASDAGLHLSQKPDSEDICFVPDHDYAAFIRRRTGQTEIPGDFVDEQGHVLGRHRGIWHYTIGQRKGLGISLGQPMYVKRIDPAHNCVVLGPEGCQYSGGCLLEGMNYHETPPQEPFTVWVKLRYSAPLCQAVCQVLPGDKARLLFSMPQRSVTPGQSAVLYDAAGKVLGGGLILCPDDGQT